MSLPDATKESVLTALREADTVFMSRMVEFYELMASAIGLRLRHPFTFEHLAAAGAAVVEGLALRFLVNRSTVEPPLEFSMADGTTEAWSLATTACFAVIDAYTEVLEEWTPPDDAALFEKFQTLGVTMLETAPQRLSACRLLRRAAASTNDTTGAGFRARPWRPRAATSATRLNRIADAGGTVSFAGANCRPCQQLARSTIDVAIVGAP